ncbi:Multidrug resistance protein MdtA [Andreprevotia sp. IGB-42]|uniref:efflux RND transporter periplasmic adaptor subunit n=1 Tax=Andreprevotia sp. IGB-42 TaxID=2497473 RepID=UPI0013592C6D|nr:efflux RND transporter periplasmic adaptor subunit [Andreprevotia sp. IGB-42]KAF0813330.1 Multidrug resistance protein MdtA [Andreprevotia sp. IGB-42]
MRRLSSPFFCAVLLSAGFNAGHAAKAASDDAQADPNAMRVLLAPKMETTLSSQMNGTISDLNITLGKRVAKGAVLAQLDCSEVLARGNVTKAELNMAKQNLAAKHGLQQLDAAGEIEVALATTEVEKANGALALNKAQQGYCKVLAPFSGRVAKVYVKAYQTVAAGTPVVDLVSDGPLKVRLNVPSTLLKKMKPGTRLDVSIHETGNTYPARVSAINARVDAVAQTVELEAQLDAANPELIAGMSGVARFPAAQ